MKAYQFIDRWTEIKGSLFKFCVYCFCFYISTEKNKNYQLRVANSVIAFSEASVYFGKNGQNHNKRKTEYFKMVSELQKSGFRSTLWSFHSSTAKVQEQDLIVPKIELSTHCKHLCIDISRSTNYQSLIDFNISPSQGAYLVIGNREPDPISDCDEPTPTKSIADLEDEMTKPNAKEDPRHANVYSDHDGVRIRKDETPSVLETMKWLLLLSSG